MPDLTGDRYDDALIAAEETTLASRAESDYSDIDFTNDENPFEADTERGGLVSEDRAPAAARAEAGDGRAAEAEQASTPEAGECSGAGSEENFGLKARRYEAE